MRMKDRKDVRVREDIKHSPALQHTRHTEAEVSLKCHHSRQLECRQGRSIDSSDFQATSKPVLLLNRHLLLWDLHVADLIADR